MVKASAEGMAGQNQAAIESYEIALKLAPNKAGAFCSMAHHLKTIGKQDEAVTAYRKAININLIILNPIGVWLILKPLVFR
jgi:Tfp pilus assembly protein PilF